MDLFFCAGCRFQYPLAKAAHITTGAHRDGEPVGFCDACAGRYIPELVADLDDEPERVTRSEEQPATA